MPTGKPMITASNLEPGDRLRDTDGHGETNPWGPDYTDKIVVKKRWGRAEHDRWDHDSWLLAPVTEKGTTSKNGTFAVTFKQIDERLASGRYEPIDCEVNRTLDGTALPVDTDEDVYIRFGDLPNDERSYNSTDDCYEDGVSVYAADIESVPSESDADAMFVPHGPKILQVLLLLTRDTYLVTGETVGTGTDGEPVLRNVTVVAELEYSDAVNGWVITDD